MWLVVVWYLIKSKPENEQRRAVFRGQRALAPWVWNRYIFWIKIRNGCQYLWINVPKLCNYCKSWPSTSVNFQLSCLPQNNFTNCQQSLPPKFFARCDTLEGTRNTNLLNDSGFLIRCWRCIIERQKDLFYRNSNDCARVQVNIEWKKKSDREKQKISNGIRRNGTRKRMSKSSSIFVL